MRYYCDVKKLREREKLCFIKVYHSGKPYKSMALVLILQQRYLEIEQRILIKKHFCYSSYYICAISLQLDWDLNNQNIPSCQK